MINAICLSFEERKLFVGNMQQLKICIRRENKNSTAINKALIAIIGTFPIPKKSNWLFFSEIIVLTQNELTKK